MKRAALLLAAVTACDAPSTPADAAADAAPDGGPTCTELSWDPASGALTRWPEPSLVVDDATTETGLRLRFGADAWLDFLRTRDRDGLAVIRDPYEAIDFPRP